MQIKQDSMDKWMYDVLNDWSNQGTLPMDKSRQLHMQIRDLAQQEKKNRLTNKIVTIIAAVITLFWMLFASCPVAAASYYEYQIASTGSAHIIVFVLSIIPVLVSNIYQFQLQGRNKQFEVKYE